MVFQVQTSDGRLHALPSLRSLGPCEHMRSVFSQLPLVQLQLWAFHSVSRRPTRSPILLPGIIST